MVTKSDGVDDALAHAVPESGIFGHESPSAKTRQRALCLRWQETVTVVAADMRAWQAPEPADVLVSELLGSFGDNELSPECLDGAQRFLTPGGISIPAASTSQLCPVTAAKLWNDAKVTSPVLDRGSGQRRRAQHRQIERTAAQTASCWSCVRKPGSRRRQRHPTGNDALTGRLQRARLCARS